jgi:proteasome assembly chaperone (PAC2) family protein
MAPLRFLEAPEPDLNQPILIGAFAGWSDAGGAASGAAKYLIDRWHATRIAEIEAEDFYDFTQLRPTVKYIHDVRVIEWPQNAFYYHRAQDRDLILFNGIEPHLKWQTYIRSFLDVVEHYKVSMVVSLGAMFVDYPHTRPMRVTGQAPNDELQEKAGLFTRGGRYEGPTGINGVLNATLRDMDVQAATIWANVPHYVSASPNPPASLALIKSLTAMLDLEVPLTRMMRHATAFESQLNEATAKNTEVSEYVRSLEERIDAENEIIRTPQELPAAENLVQDVEEFLRRSSQGPQA